MAQVVGDVLHLLAAALELGLRVRHDTLELLDPVDDYLVVRISIILLED